MSKQLKSGNAIGRLLLKHGEKIVMLGILACAGMLVWSSMGRERLPESNYPDKLVSLSSSADTKVTNMDWNQFPEEEKLLASAVPQSSGVMKEIPGTAFPVYKHRLDPSVLADVGYRMDPTLLAPVELEVNAGSGLWASANEEEILRRRIEAYNKAQEEIKEREKAKEAGKNARDTPGRGGGYGGEFGGEYGGGYGGATGRDSTNPDGPLVVRPRGGQVQGYETIDETSWVTVLAKVPYETQMQLYRDALQNARGYSEKLDAPRYYGYKIQRAEVVNGKTGEWADLDTVSDSHILEAQKKWPRNARQPEVVDKRYVHPLMTYPLPPMAVRSWGEDVTHSDLPLPSLEPVYEESDATEPDGEEEKVELDAFGKPIVDKTKRKKGRSPYGRGEYGGGYGGEFGGGEYGGEFGGGEYGGRGEYGGEFGGGYGGEFGGGYGGEFGGGPPTAEGPTELPPFVWDQKTSELLFRYFDNTVTPGRRYRYRVKFALYDVNDDRPERLLDKTVTERRKELSKGARRFRLTEWSELSPVASVPLPGLIFVAGGEEANESNYSDEPEAKLIVKALDSKYAAEVAVSKWFRRGSVVNVLDEAEVIWASKFQLEEGEKEPKFAFFTGMTLVDFYGGEPFTKKNDELTQPTRALFMDASGRLLRQSELDDLEPVEEYTEILESKESNSSRGGGYGGEFGGEYGGEFGGGEF